MRFISVAFNRERCIYCGGCVSVCPKDALTLKEIRMKVDPKKCIDCGICVRFCPVEAIKLRK